MNSLAKGIWDTTVADDEAISIVFGGLLFIVVIVVLAWIFGTIGFYLGSVAFPEYISFEWGFWKPLALGLLIWLI